MDLRLVTDDWEVTASPEEPPSYKEQDVRGDGDANGHDTGTFGPAVNIMKVLEQIISLGPQLASSDADHFLFTLQDTDGDTTCLHAKTTELTALLGRPDCLGEVEALERNAVCMEAVWRQPGVRQHHPRSRLWGARVKAVASEEELSSVDVVAEAGADLHGQP